MESREEEGIDVGVIDKTEIKIFDWSRFGLYGERLREMDPNE
jgi:hypothetical protein